MNILSYFDYNGCINYFFDMGLILFILIKDIFFMLENLKENVKKIFSWKVGFKIYVEMKLVEELNLKCK